MITGPPLPVSIIACWWRGEEGPLLCSVQEPNLTGGNQLQTWPITFQTSYQSYTAAVNQGGGYVELTNRTSLHNHCQCPKAAQPGMSETAAVCAAAAAVHAQDPKPPAAQSNPVPVTCGQCATLTPRCSSSGCACLTAESLHKAPRIHKSLACDCNSSYVVCHMLRAAKY
jgi:hypothetical protein